MCLGQGCEEIQQESLEVTLCDTYCREKGRFPQESPNCASTHEAQRLPPQSDHRAAEPVGIFLVQIKSFLQSWFIPSFNQPSAHRVQQNSGPSQRHQDAEARGELISGENHSGELQPIWKKGFTTAAVGEYRQQHCLTQHTAQLWLSPWKWEHGITAHVGKAQLCSLGAPNTDRIFLAARNAHLLMQSCGWAAGELQPPAGAGRSLPCTGASLHGPASQLQLWA